MYLCHLYVLHASITLQDVCIWKNNNIQIQQDLIVVDQEMSTKNDK